VGKTRTLAAGAVVLAAVAGCSASGGTSAPHPVQTAALTASRVVQLAATQARSETSLTATIDARAQGAATADVSGTVREQLKPSLFADVTMPTVNISGAAMPGGMEEILAPTALYLRMSIFTQMTGKRWVKVPFSELSTATGGVNLGQLLQQAQNTDPATQAQFLAGASDVREAGTSVLNGVPVTEYTGTISMTTALRRLPASLRSQLSQDIEKAGIASADFKVWLDSQHRVRKMIMTEQGSAVTEVITMVVTSINVPVNTQLPAASETATVPASALKG
jgi:hypothetical protein